MDDVELLEQQAIDAAISLRWDQAIALNNQIIKLDPENDSVYLRLGFIYLQLKDMGKAKKYYLKALRIQPKNAVALQNLERIRVLEKAKAGKGENDHVAFDPDLFIEATGKTKTVALANLGQKSVLASLRIGQPVTMGIKKHRVEIRTTNNDYIGTLPDDLSKRLIHFLKAKSAYVTYIKEATLTKVIVFIKEEKKGKGVTHQISFLANVQRKINDESPAAPGQEDKEEVETEDTEEHMEAWEKMANESASNEDKDILIDIHPEDLEEEDEE